MTLPDAQFCPYLLASLNARTLRGTVDMIGYWDVRVDGEVVGYYRSLAQAERVQQAIVQLIQAKAQGSA